MELDLIESKNPKISQKNDLIFTENQTESIKNLLYQLNSGDSDKSSLLTKLYQIIQASVNPRIEAIWIYAALSFQNSNVANEDVLGRVSILKALFQLISACSASCSKSKSVALLAPIIFEVYRLIHEFWRSDLSGKRDKKAMKESVSLVETILGYINVCCCDSLNAEDDNDDLVTSVISVWELVYVWTKGSGSKDNDVRSFLPLASEEDRGKFIEGECDVSFIAGVVTLEAFLLRLCLKFRDGFKKPELEKELRDWAVGSITGFKCCDFYENLLRVLMESTLPVTSLLNFEEENMLRKVLYDAVILVDYSFLNIGSMQPPNEPMKRLTLSRLIITHEAVNFFRENGGTTGAISYSAAFSGSSLPSRLTRWVTAETGANGKLSKPNESSPIALIRWLLKLEDHGLRMFDDSLAKFLPRLTDIISKARYDQTEHDVKDMKLDTDLFFVDKKGEDEDEGEEDRDQESKEKRKRKDKSSKKKKKQIKFRKYDLQEKSGSAKEKALFTNDDGLSSYSDVE